LHPVSQIRTDNEIPFAGSGLMGLSKLSIGWIKLGMVIKRIQPGKPQQKGRHQRMNRTLKQYPTNPAAKTLNAQQKRFDELPFNLLQSGKTV
jgi:hypothetical protein